MSITEFLRRNAAKDLLRFSTMGSVDDGKSTLIGRLLYDTRSIYEDQLSALRSDSERIGTTGGALDYALLTDGLKAEREQGITIDVAYRYFSTPKRNFIIADTPGHEQYTRNMATGASTANVAIILIDARHGVLTQTKRHSFIASLLGIPRLLIAVNKMDLVDYSGKVFERIVQEYTDFAARLDVVDLTFVPISALRGDNVVTTSAATPWYHGESVLEYLEHAYIGSDRNLVDLRFPVQHVLRPHHGFRGYAGQIVSGTVRRGDEIMVVPAMKTSRIASISRFDGDLDHAFAPMSVTLTLDDDIDVSRGDLLVHPRNLPRLQTDCEAMVVWMAESPLDPERTYLVKHTTRTIRVAVKHLDYRVDVNTLHRTEAPTLRLNEIGRVAFQATQRLFIDPYAKNRHTGSFILVDPQSNDTVAAGMVIDRMPEEQLRTASNVPRSDHIRHEPSGVGRAEHETLVGHRACTVWFTGLSGSGKSSVAREVEHRLHARGRHVVVLDGDNLRFGLNRDLAFSTQDRAENIRRVAEVARLFNDAGTIVLVPVIAPFREHRERAREIIGAASFLEVYVNTPIGVCESRDTKGLYGKARRGEIAEFTGISSPYEPPERPAVTLNTVDASLTACAERLIDLIEAAIRLA